MRIEFRRPQKLHYRACC